MPGVRNILGQQIDGFRVIRIICGWDTLYYLPMELNSLINFINPRHISALQLQLRCDIHWNLHISPDWRAEMTCLVLSRLNWLNWLSSYEFRYVEPGQALRSTVFTIPLDHCGTEVATKASQIGSAENVMIVQLDPLVQVNMNSQPSLVSGMSISSIVH